VQIVEKADGKYRATHEQQTLKLQRNQAPAIVAVRNWRKGRNSCRSRMRRVPLMRTLISGRCGAPDTGVHSDHFSCGRVGRCGDRHRHTDGNRQRSANLTTWYSIGQIAGPALVSAALAENIVAAFVASAIALAIVMALTLAGALTANIDR
jgi:hypothetical protein